jgi:outer membrane protein OmpA-like peptidoglycan-associated protein
VASSKREAIYNLAEISPEEYRKERAFTDPKNNRVWLSGSDLFQSGANGEELSAKGMSLLNAAVTQNGDPRADDPIIIEGYSTAGVPADQLRLSRHRGDLVRQYLQAHFQFDPRSTGVVALKNLPPKDVHRAAWDGICIVVLRRG